MNQNARPWYFWPLIAFVAGLLIGWLVIGWGLWPVTWTNAQVRDLRPDLRLDYVGMVAESYAQTRNLDLARSRLSGWSEDELPDVLAEAQTVLVARNPQAAQSVQDLAAALGAIAPAGAGAGQPGPEPQPAGPAQGPAAGGVANLRQICAAGLFILLALAALALLVYLFRRWRATQSGRVITAESDLDGEDDTFSVADQEKSRWPANQVPVSEPRPVRGSYGAGSAPGYGGAGGESAEPDEMIAPRSPQVPVPVAGAPRSDTRSEPPRADAPEAAARPAGKEIEITTQEATYQMGEADYDEAFDINDKELGFLGQFGLQLSEPFGRERDQAVALQVWLWDSSDPDTQTKVLMSEGAYRDTALRSQHAGEFLAIAVRPGQVFDLESHELILKGRVEKVSYAEAEPPRGIFAELRVKMTVSRKV